MEIFPLAAATASDRDHTARSQNTSGNHDGRCPQNRSTVARTTNAKNVANQMMRHWPLFTACTSETWGTCVNAHAYFNPHARGQSDRTCPRLPAKGTDSTGDEPTPVEYPLSIARQSNHAVQYAAPVRVVGPAPPVANDDVLPPRTRVTPRGVYTAGRIVPRVGVWVRTIDHPRRVLCHEPADGRIVVSRSVEIQTQCGLAFSKCEPVGVARSCLRAHRAERVVAVR